MPCVRGFFFALVVCKMDCYISQMCTRERIFRTLEKLQFLTQIVIHMQNKLQKIGLIHH